MLEILKGATLVNEGRIVPHAWVAVEDGIIASMGEGNPAEGLLSRADAVTDLGGDYLLPGVIDEHVHLREPGLTHKGDIATETRAAVAGGVTSVMDMPNVKPPTVTSQLLAEKMETAKNSSLTNYSFYLGATADNLDELLHADYRQVCGVKVFMGSSTGGMLLDDTSALHRLFSSVPALIAAHCEDETIIRANRQKYIASHGEYIPACDHPKIRSREACLESTKRAVALAKETGARLHVLHVSTADEVEYLAEACAADGRITAEACVGHLWFCDEDYARLGDRIRVNPAVKTAADRDALRRAVADGSIAVVATDHAPHLWSEKSENKLNIPSGMPLAQFSLIAMLELSRQGHFSPERVVEVMCHAPARLFGIDRRGFVRPCYFADLVQVGRVPEGWTVADGDVLSRCQWTPLNGTKFHHKVARTWVNGHKVFDGKQVDDSIKGKQLTFNR